jgi:hypothetical protein
MRTAWFRGRGCRISNKLEQSRDRFMRSSSRIMLCLAVCLTLAPWAGVALAQDPAPYPVPTKVQAQPDALRVRYNL